MDEKLELLPQVILDRIDYAYEQRLGDAAAYAKQYKERHGLTDAQAAKRLRYDQKYNMLKKRDEENSAYLAKMDRWWEALKDLGVWTLTQVATYPDRYNKVPSFRDVANGHPRRVTRHDVRAVLEHLVELGFVEASKVKPSRGPAATRYEVTDDGREALVILEVAE